MVNNLIRFFLRIKIILFVYKILYKIKILFIKISFAQYIKLKHLNFTLVGPIYFINKNVKIGTNVVIYPDVMFFGDGLIDIGDNVVIGNGTIIYSSKMGGVIIKSNTLIAAHCYIIDMDHGISKENIIKKQENSISKVIIEEDCWIGAGAKILKGSIIKQGSVIGAQSVVKSTTLPYSINVGIPSHLLKYR